MNTEDTLPIRVRLIPYTEEESNAYEGLYSTDDFELYHIKLYDNMGEIPYIAGQAMKQVGWATGWTSYRLFPTHEERCTIGGFAGLRMADFEIKRHIAHLYTRMAQNSFENMIKMSEVRK